jgi:thioredoxin 2
MIICPHCSALTPQQANSLDTNSICDHCHAPLFDARPITLTSANFNAHARTSDLPLLVEFWASEYESMVPLMGTAFKAAAAQLEPQFRLGRLEIEDEPAIAAEYEIQSIPTFAIFRHGRTLSRRSGVMMTRYMVEWAEAVLAG